MPFARARKRGNNLLLLILLLLLHEHVYISLTPFSPLTVNISDLVRMDAGFKDVARMLQLL